MEKYWNIENRSLYFYFFSTIIKVIIIIRDFDYIIGLYLFKKMEYININIYVYGQNEVKERVEWWKPLLGLYVEKEAPLTDFALDWISFLS